MANTIIVIPEEDFPSVEGCDIQPSPKLDYSIHNNLRMIQGGEEDQRYHVDTSEYLAIHNANNPSQTNVFATFADLTTGNVVETTNLYFTQARVRATTLAGFVVGANSSIAAGDTILQAFGKTQGQINARVPLSRIITAGNGLTGGGDLTIDRTITLGTPSAITNSTTNSVTTTSHTHELLLTDADLVDILGFTPVPDTRTITAGNGLTGGGTLAANRSIVLGTPSSITLASTNSVTASSHTHALALGGTAAQYLRGDNTLATFPAIPQGTVTSVAMSVPAALLSVTGSPITSSGTLAITLPTRTANLVFSGPASGAAATPTFRALVAADIPNLNASKITAGTIDTARLGSGTASTSTYLRGDNTWATLPSSGVTSLTIGNGLTGTSPITSTGTITLGTPGTITGSTTNSVTASSHTHSLTLVAADITGALGYTPVTNARTITGVDHIVGGGSLTSNQTLGLALSTSTYVYDSQGNPRLHVGTSSGTSIDNFAIRLSHSSGVFTFRNPANDILFRVGPTGYIKYNVHESATNIINLNQAPVQRLPNRSASIVYEVQNFSDGSSCKCLVVNSNVTSPITLSINNGKLLGGNVVPPDTEAIISIQVIGPTLYYTVAVEL